MGIVGTHEVIAKLWKRVNILAKQR
jgi:hypothetical protein